MNGASVPPVPASGSGMNVAAAIEGELADALASLADGGHREPRALDAAAAALDRALALVRVFRSVLPAERRSVRDDIRAVARAIRANRRPSTDLAAFDAFVTAELASHEEHPIDGLDALRAVFVDRRNRAGYGVVGPATVEQVRRAWATAATWAPSDDEAVVSLARRAARRADARRTPSALRRLGTRARRAAVALDVVATAQLDRKLDAHAGAIGRVADRAADAAQVARLRTTLAGAAEAVPADACAAVLDGLTIRRTELVDETLVLAGEALSAKPKSVARDTAD